MNFDIDLLNAVQREVCLHTDGALLVIAGAGSGKTRTLTHRVAHLVLDKGVKAYNILAITFTNKATDEMRHRLKDLPYSQDLWISTFHSLCLRILKHGIEAIGYKKNFSIYGEPEKDRLIKRIIKENNIDEVEPKKVVYYISDAKSKGIEADSFLFNYEGIKFSQTIADIFEKYQGALKQANSLDFDDLLIKAHQVLVVNQATRDYFANKFRYIHVDEFQDTNKLQYQIVKILSSVHKNIFAVGDEDQSIYGWRGANIDNIKLYQREFGAKLYKLEQNYRSTKKILDIANKVIQNNTSRIPKVLWTDNTDGNPVDYYSASDDRREADYVVGLINDLINSMDIDPNEIAILMRVNALSRNFEERLLAYNIPHKVQGGFKFFDRKEIKDILAYFKLAANTDDNDAFLRIINFPKRGIGDASILQLNQMASLTGQSLYAVVSDYASYQSLPKALTKKLIPFAETLKAIINNKDQPLDKFAKVVFDQLDFKSVYSDNSEESYNRLLNLEEFAKMIGERVEANKLLSLEDFLDSVILYADSVNDIEQQSNSAVSISTIHSAKGLEYQVVFVVGCEEEIFPSKRSYDSLPELEEERRLMYVAITRAKKRLYLTSCRNRFMYNEQKDCMPSRFLREAELIKPKSKSNTSVDSPSNISSGIPKFVYNQPKKDTPQKDFSRFVVGAKISHNKFGAGTIVSMSGTPSSPYAEINFETMGKMTLSLAHAPVVCI